ncbi:hypothetical protein AMELA_G00143900 [Ameiurus melas]|uniref:Small integral membrane protein 26 n=1 Tax=Ameiurus melas TaxID=219545 RepID=A0A7J6ALM5_AMEME|nr:hypothetical protein AMELA_G00143900 [Ameiurus melas]
MPFDGKQWYKRTAQLYAVGTWTLLGSCAYYTYFKCNDRVVLREEEEDVPPNVRIFKSSHMSAKLTYKENFVPYSTRFLELFKPKAENSSGGQNDEK